MNCLKCLQWQGEVKWRVKERRRAQRGEERRGQGDEQVASYCLYPPHMSRPPLSWQVWDTMCWPKGLLETCKWINIELWESKGVLNDTSNDAHPLQSIPLVQKKLMNTTAVCRQSHSSKCSFFEVNIDISTIVSFIVSFMCFDQHPSILF